jgi:ATP-dependent DNA helicase RecG
LIIESEENLRKAMLADSEDEHLEFKAAKNNFSKDKLIDYCAALCNEGGGHFILGVTDRKPRTICGSTAFSNIQQIKSDIFIRIRRRIDIVEIFTSEGRVLVFRVPPSPPGTLTDVDGRFLMRIGEELRPMTGDILREKLMRDRGDLSAEIVQGSSFDSLDPALISQFRRLASNKVRQRGDENGLEEADRIASMRDTDLLESVNLINGNLVTLAAMVLMGTNRALSSLLPQAEIIFEYRSMLSSIDYQERDVYRQGMLGVLDNVWGSINKRNEVQSFQFGLVRHQIRTFAERSIREALLNAMCHRSYDDQGAVRVLQSPRQLQVISPGSFPPGVSPANILLMSKPRNRRLHEALERCGLVERSSQGADLMFREALSSAKPKPSFDGSDAYSVFITLDGQVRDERLLAYLERVGQETIRKLGVSDLMIIDSLSESRLLGANELQQMPRLAEMGLVERAGRSKWILSKGLYTAIGRRGAYTRKRGLDYETEKELLMRHLRERGRDGSPLNELLEVLPDRTRSQVRMRLTELREERRATVVGQRALGRWYASGQEPT